jgi:hypothetical protein
MSPFIFDPDRAARVLARLPSLARLLPEPHREGRPSAVVSGMRVTDRALYRLLANPHYPHLRESLRGIECAAGAGLALKELRKAKFRGEFGSYLQEALLADHFLTRGLRVSKGRRGNGRNPDLEIVADDFSVTVEAYSPRSWQWRKDWLDDVTDTLKYADIPYAYRATVDVEVHGIPVDVELLEDMILRTGRDVLQRLTADLDTLDEAATGVTWRYEHHSGEMTTSIEFKRVQRNDTGLVRAVAMSPPGEIYRAEPEFADVLQKIREKAEKRQAERGSGELRGLVADVSRTGIDYELETGRLTLDPATAGVDLDELGLDFFAVSLPRRGKHGLMRGVRVAVLFEDTRITHEELRQLFDLPERTR